MTFTPGKHEVVRDTETCDLLRYPTTSDLFYYRRHEGRWFRGSVPNYFTERWDGEGWVLTERVHIYDPGTHGFYVAHDLRADIASGMSWSEAIAKARG